MTTTTFTENNKSEPRWTGRSTQLLFAIKEQLNGKINHLTAGWILEKLHDNTGTVPAEWKTELRSVLKNYPGFPKEDNGLYSYMFLRQLEYVCENCRMYAEDYKSVLA